MAAPGYPDAPGRAPDRRHRRRPTVDGRDVFHAGTAWRDGGAGVAGGRVLNVTALGDDLAEARAGLRGRRAIDSRASSTRSDIAAAAAGSSSMPEPQPRRCTAVWEQLEAAGPAGRHRDRDRGRPRAHPRPPATSCSSAAITFELKVLSAHGNPREVAEYGSHRRAARPARDHRGCRWLGGAAGRDRQLHRAAGDRHPDRPRRRWAGSTRCWACRCPTACRSPAWP